MKQMKEEEKKKTTKTAQTVEEALAGIKEEDFPTSMEEREKFCMEQLSTGEALFTSGMCVLAISGHTGFRAFGLLSLFRFFEALRFILKPSTDLVHPGLL